ncbi:hypothetical protein EGR_00777 [Echinococcus granulosus]|uniref:Uncharacterized protein n=1 Tax=Echinococcus granulosus TaxID=6210 RepID=W6USI6_ECHGR|nr:hypothetical protein EGR_00777 [Echinococcus granulosus]EUB64233.1 hypothetical protein EGR_00777 [Echinococcus granulosus]
MPAFLLDNQQAPYSLRSRSLQQLVRSAHLNALWNIRIHQSIALCYLPHFIPYRLNLLCISRQQASRAVNVLFSTSLVVEGCPFGLFVGSSTMQGDLCMEVFTERSNTSLPISKRRTRQAALVALKHFVPEDYACFVCGQL